MGSLLNYSIQKSGSPYWAFAIHQGHELHPDFLPHMLLNDQERLREEDPYTDLIATLPISMLKVETSRFQVDLNRAASEAIYLKPEQAWGLSVWDSKFAELSVKALRQAHENMHQQFELLIQQTIDCFGYFFLYDVHSYNCKRLGPQESVNKEDNPQINLGTYYNNALWRPLLDKLLTQMQSLQLQEQQIDVRENIKFKGGYMAQRLLQKFGHKGCIVSVEFRKDFMDEWTGQANFKAVENCRQLLQETLPSLDSYFSESYGK